MKRLELLIETGEMTGRRFAVSEGGLRLGRSSSNDIHVPDEELSRNHCLFEPSGECGIKVTDLASANGTKVNGIALGCDSCELKQGDEITAGSLRIRVVGEQTATGFDLGLSTVSRAKTTSEQGGSGGKSVRPPKLVAILWGSVAVVLSLAIYVMLDDGGSRSKPSLTQISKDSSGFKVVEFAYERVNASVNGIYRYKLSLDPQGRLSAIIDDIVDKRNKRQKKEPSKELDAKSRAALDAILDNTDFLKMDDRPYVGPTGEPPKLDSINLTVVYGNKVKKVSLVNFKVPTAFADMVEKLEVFAKTELKIWQWDRPRDELVKMASKAADLARRHWEERNVEHGNIHAAISSYDEAIELLESVDPKPSEYDAYCKERDVAKEELEKRYKKIRSEAEVALKKSSYKSAKEAFGIITRMVPDRSDRRNKEAMEQLNTIERSMRGSRK